MPKQLPVRTLVTYQAVQAELGDICDAFDVLAELPSQPLGSKHLKEATKRLRGRTMDFIKEELGYVEDSDYLPQWETDQYFGDGVSRYRSDVWPDPIAGGKYLYNRWVINYVFLCRRVSEYKYADIGTEAAEKLIDRYGLHLVGTHEAIVKSGLSKVGN